MVREIMVIITALVMSLFLGSYCLAGEHPGETIEHPGKKIESEHPGESVEQGGEIAEHPGEVAEHPGEEHSSAKSMLSAKDIIKGIKGHISEVTDNNNGYYPLYDSKEKKALRLKLIKVHEDRVSYIKKEDAYFACTDFITDDGKTKYDIDFWMKDKGGKLEVYQKKIHKKDGKPRFTYRDDEIVPIEEHMAPEGHSF
jgi:hypothetical protein